MKRVVLFLNGTDVNGKAFMITHSLEDLLAAASSKFNISAKRLFTTQGGEIDDIHLMRDDDVLYVSSGEDFISLAKKCSHSHVNNQSQWVTLNVGGKYFSTTRDTLVRKEPTSMLARMFSMPEDSEQIIEPCKRDQNGAFLIDRSPTYFEPLLNYLRHGQIILDANVNVDGVLAEAEFYRLEGVIPTLTEMINEDKQHKHDVIFTRKDVLKAIMSTPNDVKLRFQGANFLGADLSKLDLRNINFKYAVLRNCNLSGADLSGCCFERADLSHSNLVGAKLIGVNMLCANLAGADMRSCNFQDTGHIVISNVEGANLKGANLEGSNMEQVDLRVATLKNAILKNCNLRHADLAGADLESSNFSGSDLWRANLRGANFKNAGFTHMVTPLHMSQTMY